MLKKLSIILALLSASSFAVSSEKLFSFEAEPIELGAEFRLDPDNSISSIPTKIYSKETILSCEKQKIEWIGSYSESDFGTLYGKFSGICKMSSGLKEVQAIASIKYRQTTKGFFIKDTVNLTSTSGTLEITAELAP